MRHNERVLSFAAVAVDKSTARSVLVRPSGMQHNNYFDETEGASTAVPVGECGQLGGLVHNLRHNNIERPVQSSERAAQPLDLDGHGAPLPLEVVPLPVIDRLREVERVAVTEVEPRPQHPDSVEPRTKTVGDVLRHAALIIEERGWVQGDLGEQDGPYCAWGGIAVASGLLDDLHLSTKSNDLEEEALRVLQRFLGDYVPAWNDTPGRTAAEVIAALRAAADESDR